MEENFKRVTFHNAYKLRCSRRVLFEKIAKRPSEYLTVLTGFNWNQLVAFYLQCFGFLEENNDKWFRHAQSNDDAFEWIVMYHEMDELLYDLFSKSEDEIKHIEWEINAAAEFDALIEQINTGELDASYFGVYLK